MSVGAASAAGRGMRQRLLDRSRSFAWAVWATAVALTLPYPLLLYLDRGAGVNSFGLPGTSLVLDMVAVTFGALILARHPRNSIGWILAFFGLAGRITDDAQLYSVLANTVHPGTLPAAAFSAWLGSWIFLPGISLLVTLTLLLFPDGRLPSARWRLAAWASGGAVLLATVALALGAVPRVGNFRIADGGTITATDRIWDNQEFAFLPLILGFFCLAGLIVRFRRSRGEERQQLKWFAYGGLLFVSGFVVDMATAIGTPANVGPPQWANVLLETTLLGMLVAIGIAVLKYRLYDIDVVISRTLVYGALAGFITAVYVAIVVGIGSLIGSGGKPNLGLSILATAVVAVAFQPVRERLQKVANRLVYGRRATPYETLSRFSEHVAEAYEGDVVLDRMARILAEATGAATTRVWLRSSGLLTAVASWPVGAEVTEPVILDGDGLPALPESDRAAPVRHQGELLGALTVAKRRGEQLSPIEDQLLSDLAIQAGIVLKNVRLTAELLQRLKELRASRQRLVAAQDGERRRLERNLHDGAQQNVVALKVKLGLAEILIDRDPARVQQLLGDIDADTDQALDTLRDLARGLYPPLLTDKGLVAALEAQSRKAPMPVQIEAQGIDRYSQDIETAVYFCCLEALQNAAKYAEASTVRVRLSATDDALSFVVEDDGKGFDLATTKPGTGLQNMRDRLDALGGAMQVSSAPGVGTTLRGRLPVPVGALTS